MSDDTRINNDLINPSIYTKTLSTRIPKSLHDYLYRLAKTKKKSVTKVMTESLYIMLEVRPQDKGLKWRSTQCIDNSVTKVNVVIPESLAAKVEREAKLYDISASKYLCTSLYFYARYVCHPDTLKKPVLH